MMTRRWVAVLAISITLALAGGGIALSQGQSKSDKASKKEQLRDSFVTHLAEELGVSADRLRAALRKAGIATVDDAVKAGLITAEQAKLIKEKIAAGEIGDFGLGLGRFKHKDHGLRGGPKMRAFAHLLGTEAARNAVLDAVAKTLGVTRAQFLADRKAGKELEELMTAKSVTKEKLGVAVAAALKPFVDKLVAAKELTRERADAFLERLGDGRMLGKIVAHAARTAD
jgi:hypothetical protein